MVCLILYENFFQWLWIRDASTSVRCLQFFYLWRPTSSQCSWSNHSTMLFKGRPPKFATFIMLFMASIKDHVHGLWSSPSSFLIKGWPPTRSISQCLARTLSTQRVILAIWVNQLLINSSDMVKITCIKVFSKNASNYMRFGCTQVLSRYWVCLLARKFLLNLHKYVLIHFRRLESLVANPSCP